MPSVAVTSDRARRMVNAALAKGDEMGLRISAAVVDPAGFLVAFGRADGAGPYTSEVAQGKAYAVIFMARPSAEIRELAQSRPQFFDALKNLGWRTLIPSPGGVPISGGGAIGVSGAPDPDQDVAIAQWAIDQTADLA